MKNFINILGLVVGTAFAVVLVWAFLYLCIPNIKDGTDKLFKWGDYAETQTEDDKEDITYIAPATNAQFVFENDFITITVG